MSSQSPIALDTSTTPSPSSGLWQVKGSGSPASTDMATPLRSVTYRFSSATTSGRSSYMPASGRIAAHGEPRFGVPSMTALRS